MTAPAASSAGILLTFMAHPGLCHRDKFFPLLVLAFCSSKPQIQDYDLFLQMWESFFSLRLLLGALQSSLLGSAEVQGDFWCCPAERGGDSQCRTPDLWAGMNA